jgi:hypothetical protein
MKDYNKEELELHFRMIQECLEESLKNLKLGLGDPRNLSQDLLEKYKQDVMNILDMPFGGTLSPGEYAEMILLKFFDARSDYEAAATLMS